MQFYLSVKDTWEAMFDDCRQAERSIDFEQYIIENDEVGKRFLGLLTEKARSGVRVRLILDAVGSWNIRNSALVDELKKAGGKVMFYHPVWIIQALFPNTWFPRNHCKVMIIDKKIAYVGGVCLMETMRDWRDTQTRITEPLVQAISDDFACFWNRLAQDDETAACPTPDTGGTLQYIVQQPRAGRAQVYTALLAAIDNAKHYVYFATPYFYPPRRLRAALRRARSRGVEIAIILSERTDISFSDQATRAFLPKLLRLGFKVFFYRDTVLHAKYAVIDDQWATVGSTNFDHLSLIYNRESNILIRESAIVNELKSHFLNDATRCIPATLQGLHNQSWRDRLIGFIGSMMHRVLNTLVLPAKEA